MAKDICGVALPGHNGEGGGDGTDRGAAVSSGRREATLNSLGLPGGWSAAMMPSIASVASSVKQLEPAAARPINLANFAEHLLIWALGPLREAATERVSPHSLAPEAVFLPVVVMECTEEQLGPP